MDYLLGIKFAGTDAPDRYPYNIPAVRHLVKHKELWFTKPVTFFVGENDTGKSTLLETIAIALGFNPEGGSRDFFSTREILCRKRAAARPIAVTFIRLNQLIRGWINYFGIGSMKGFMQEYGAWLRHKVRVVILKQWKKPKTIYKNLQKLNRIGTCRFTDEDIFKVANSRLGWYHRCAGDVVNYALSPKILGLKTKDRPGLVDPLAYYLARCT